MWCNADSCEVWYLAHIAARHKPDAGRKWVAYKPGSASERKVAADTSNIWWKRWVFVYCVVLKILKVY